MKQSILLLLLALSIFTFQACEKEELADDPFEALGSLTLPDLAIFSIPVDPFEEIGKGEVSTKSQTRQHWAHAGLNILGWNTGVVLNLAVPVAAWVQPSVKIVFI